MKYTKVDARKRAIDKLRGKTRDRMREESLPEMEKLVKAPMKVSVMGDSPKAVSEGMLKAQEILRAKMEDEDLDLDESGKDLLSLEELVSEMMPELDKMESEEDEEGEENEEYEEDGLIVKPLDCGCPSPEECDCPMVKEMMESESEED